MKIDDYTKAKREMLHTIGKTECRETEFKLLSFFISHREKFTDSPRNLFRRFLSEYKKLGGHTDVTRVEYPKIVEAYEEFITSISNTNETEDEGV